MPPLRKVTARVHESDVIAQGGENCILNIQGKTNLDSFGLENINHVGISSTKEYLSKALILPQKYVRNFGQVFVYCLRGHYHCNPVS